MSSRITKTNGTYYITGAQGFIGSWIIKLLLDNNVTKPSNIIATDLKYDDGILSQLIDSNSLSQITRENIDVTSFNAVFNSIKKYQPDFILHLAGLQIPTCRANPILGANVNVIGTLNIFESAKRMNDDSNNNKVLGVVYASSAGVCGPQEDYNNGTANDTDYHVPRTHYGYYKLCNEGNARIYFQDHNIASVGLRPLTVFGVGRELGLTSDVTKAIKASILKVPFTINYRGTTLFHYVKDIAELWIKCCGILKTKPNAYNCNIKGNTLSVKQFVDYLEKLVPDARQYVTINPNGIVLPFPDKMNQQTLDKLFGTNGTPVTDIRDSIRETVDIFTTLRNQNRLHRNDIPSIKTSKL